MGDMDGAMALPALLPIEGWKPMALPVDPAFGAFIFDMALLAGCMGIWFAGAALWLPGMGGGAAAGVAKGSKPKSFVGPLPTLGSKPLLTAGTGAGAGAGAGVGLEGSKSLSRSTLAGAAAAGRAALPLDAAAGAAALERLAGWGGGSDLSRRGGPHQRCSK